MSLLENFKAKAAVVALSGATALSGCQTTTGGQSQIEAPPLTPNEGRVLGTAAGAALGKQIDDDGDLSKLLGVAGGVFGGALAAQKGHCDQRVTSSRNPRTGQVYSDRVTDVCDRRTGFPSGVPALNY